MRGFTKFLEELESNILRENLTYVSRVTGVSRMTLIRCFRENECVPRLATIYKLMIFVDWQLSISFNNETFIDFDIENVARKALNCVDYTMLKNKSDVLLLEKFLSGQSNLSLYKLYILFPKLGLKIKVIKPDYQLNQVVLNDAIYG